jgi:hypothetical protein
LDTLQRVRERRSSGRQHAGLVAIRRVAADAPKAVENFRLLAERRYSIDRIT